jgi:hypothetical protein
VGWRNLARTCHRGDMFGIRGDRLFDGVADHYLAHALVLLDQGAIVAVETLADARRDVEIVDLGALRAVTSVAGRVLRLGEPEGPHRAGLRRGPAGREGRSSHRSHGPAERRSGLPGREARPPTGRCECSPVRGVFNGCR